MEVSEKCFLKGIKDVKWENGVINEKMLSEEKIILKRYWIEHSFSLLKKGVKRCSEKNQQKEERESKCWTTFRVKVIKKWNEKLERGNYKQ